MSCDSALMKNGDTAISHKNPLHFSRQCTLTSGKLALKSSFSDSSVQIIEKSVSFSSSLPDLSSCHSQLCESQSMEKTTEFLRLCHHEGENSTEICDNLIASRCYCGSKSCNENDTSVSNCFGANLNNERTDNTEKKSCKPAASKNSSKRRKVHFADDVGKKLTEFLEYDSDDELVLHNVPPFEISEPCIISWTKEFNNPIENYVTFYNKLNAQCVLLENFHIKDTYCEASIMVKNIGFEKIVTMRVTYDSWTSSIDVSAFYSPSQFPSPYDKFTCTLALPDDECETIEFAIQYVCSTKEFWDNNDGVNYKLRKLSGFSHHMNFAQKSYNDSNLVCPAGMRYDDLMYPNFDFYKDKYDMYSSWNHFTDDGRYY